MAKKVVTVKGPVSADDLGITLMHEHLIVDLYEFFYIYEYIVDDEALLIEEVMYFKRCGGGTIVDVTNIGAGRDPRAALRISEATGLHVVLGSAWYREKVYPDYIYQRTPSELARMIVKELTEGIEDTGIRAGLIGEIGTERGYMTPAAERVFRAGARAHKETGALISTHTTHFGELATLHLDIFEEEGVDLTRVVVGHMGDYRGIDDLLPVVERGATVQFDHVGWSEFQKDEQRAENIRQLVDRGHLERVVASLDMCRRSFFHWFGGKGFDFLITSFVPMLKEVGLSDEQVRTILVDNPKNLLAY
jgi:phosphotriesterase-related protein